MSNLLLTASEFANICQVTPRTIRWYQKQDLLKPVKKDAWNNYAYFAPDQALKVYRIKLLQQFSLPLKQIKNQLSKSLNLDEELRQLENFIQQKQAELKFLKSNQDIFSDEGDLTKHIKKDLVGPFDLFSWFIEHGDYYKIDGYIRELKSLANTLGIKYKDPAITLYLDDGYNPKDAKLEIALICTGAFQAKDLALPKDYSFKRFKKIKVLAFDFQGPYGFIEFAYKKLNKHLEDQKIKVAAPVFEYYLKNPMNTKNKLNYLTKICFPI